MPEVKNIKKYKNPIDIVGKIIYTKCKYVIPIKIPGFNFSKGGYYEYKTTISNSGTN
jgi:hypothetical protein